jgi:oxysterol-binding protein-related protein 3/6/7
MKSVNFGVYSLPVSVGFNEPISFIQKAVEQFEYSYLLDKAAEFTSREQTLEQMIYLVGFDLASYRKKPFSPLLNQTYECDRV